MSTGLITPHLSRSLAKADAILSLSRHQRSVSAFN